MLSDQLTFLAPEGTRDRLDELARRENRNLGSMLRHIVLQYLDELEEPEGPRRIPNQPRYGDGTWFDNRGK